MSKVIPHGANTDSSYAVDASMTNKDGDTYYKPVAPAPPVRMGFSGPGAVPADLAGTNAPAPNVTQTVTVVSDADHRVPAVPHTGP